VPRRPPLRGVRCIGAHSNVAQKVQAYAQGPRRAVSRERPGLPGPRLAVLQFEHGSRSHRRVTDVPNVRPHDLGTPRRLLDAPSPRRRTQSPGLLVRSMRLHPLASNGQDRAAELTEDGSDPERRPPRAFSHRTSCVAGVRPGLTTTTPFANPSDDWIGLQWGRGDAVTARPGVGNPPRSPSAASTVVSPVPPFPSPRCYVAILT